MQRYQNSLHFKFFPISVEGGGHRKSIFSQIQKSPNYPRGGGGQENYGLFPQIMVFFILNRPLIPIIYQCFEGFVQACMCILDEMKPYKNVKRIKSFPF